MSVGHTAHTRSPKGAKPGASPASELANSEAGDAPGFAPLGERVWAVCPTDNRLYYSLWVENIGSPNLSQANEIWSIALDGSGGFVAGTAVKEIDMPGPACQFL